MTMKETFFSYGFFTYAVLWVCRNKRVRARSFTFDSRQAARSSKAQIFTAIIVHSRPLDLAIFRCIDNNV